MLVHTGLHYELRLGPLNLNVADSLELKRIHDRATFETLHSHAGPPLFSLAFEKKFSALMTVNSVIGQPRRSEPSPREEGTWGSYHFSP